MKLNKTILRVFEVRAKPGKADALRTKLAETSVDVVRGKPGNLGYFFGDDLSSGEHDLVFVSVWQDLDAIKSLFGADWQQSFLPEGYGAMIERCAVRHIEVDGNLVS